MRTLGSLGIMVCLWAGLSRAKAADVGGDPCWIRAVGSSEHRVWVLCEERRLFVTEDHGNTWAPRPLPETGKLRAVSFLDARRGFVAGDHGTLLATQDGGYTWVQVTLPTREHLTAMHWQNESGWIAGYGGAIVHSGDGGRTWDLQNSRVSQALEGIYFADPDHGWAVGWVGTIVRTTDGGHNWERADTSATTMWSLSSVYFGKPDDGWAVGFSGQILRSRDGGYTWQPQESPLKSWLTSVMFDRRGKGWITADTHLLSTEDGGETWQAIPTDDRLFLSWLVSAEGTLWAIGQYGVMKQSPDGLAWRRVETPGKFTLPPSRFAVSGATAALR